MLFNPKITDFVKTSHLFHVIIIELKRQKQIYSIILPESKKIMSSKITSNRQRHKGAWLNRIQKEVEKVWPPPLSLNNFSHFGSARLFSFIFIRPSSDGTYYGMVMSVRVSVRPSGSPSVRPGLRPSVRSPSAHFPHFSPTCFDILSWNFAHDFVLMYYISSSTVVTLRQFLKELCLFVNLE